MNKIDGLTKEQVLAMEPGRDLDALVAEKIFGVNNPDARWSPSTDISSSWEVVEEITKKGYDVRIFVVDGYNVDVEIDFYVGDRLIKRLSHHASTAPEAICKAALIACLEVIDQ